MRCLNSDHAGLTILRRKSQSSVFVRSPTQMIFENQVHILDARSPIRGKSYLLVLLMMTTEEGG